MELTVSHEAGYVLACTVGPIDNTAGELFREYLHPLVGQPGTKVVLDLSKSNLVTSAGLGQLVSLVVHANTSSSQVVFAAVTPFLSVVFDRSKLNAFFTSADTVAEAVEALKVP
jgi:anti-anti-sigma factor